MDPPKLASHLNPAHVPLLEQKTLTARRFLLRATKICELGEGREWPRGLPPGGRPSFAPFTIGISLAGAASGLMTRIIPSRATVELPVAAPYPEWHNLPMMAHGGPP